VVLLLLPLLMLLDVQLHLLSPPLLMSSQTVGHVARGPPRQKIGYGHIRQLRRLSHRPQVVALWCWPPTRSRSVSPPSDPLLAARRSTLPSLPASPATWAGSRSTPEFLVKLLMF